MTHIVITGKTLSGKTSFCKELVKEYKAAGISSLVFDPMKDPDWNADFVTSNPDEFMKVVWESRGCALFVDEASESAGQYDKEFFKLATKGRHWGHRTHFLIQRYKSLHTNIRSNLSEIICFNVSRSDAKLIFEDFDYDEILSANRLPKGHYIHARSMGGAETHKMFWAD